MKNCREVIRILSEDRPLGWIGRAQLQLHLLLCRNCNAFAKHLEILKKSLVALIDRKVELTDDEYRSHEEDIIKLLEQIKTGDGFPP